MTTLRCIWHLIGELWCSAPVVLLDHLPLDPARPIIPNTRSTKQFLTTEHAFRERCTGLGHGELEV